jgi:histidine triad (HIT) family protein
MTNCIFCEIVKRKSPSSIVYEDDACMAFMDIQPVNPGHVLVVPKQHFIDLKDLPPHIGGHLFQVAQQIALSLPRTKVQIEGVDLFLAHGEAAGQDVFHVHLHVIPRYEGDGFGFKFGPNYRNLPERSELDTIATQIKHQLEK